MAMQLESSSVEFPSRRSVVHSTKGIVASSQPLASACGVKILEQGGNAADKMAAVATAAALTFLEPMSTGVGGDAFAIYYEAKKSKLHGVNGSGKSPKATSIDLLRKQGLKGSRIPASSIHSITVPGAVAAWCDVVDKWGNGKLTMEQILQPAIDLAENGAPMSNICAQMWGRAVAKLQNASPNYGEMLNAKGGAPKEGEVFSNKTMASVFRNIAKDGKDGFYKGRVAEAIVQVIKDRGGVMTLDDLASHTTKFVDTVTIETDQGVKLHELPPNGHGIVALIAAGIIKQLDRKGVIDLKSMEHNSVEYLHLIIETLKFAFKDGEEYITDIDKLDYNVEDLLTDEYLAERAKLFDPTKANPDFDHGVINPKYRSDTVYFTASDSEGNACSFINSLYQGFGSAVIPKGCGFCLQNRGSNFNLTPGTRNSLEGGKRPYHTIIPAAITNVDGSLLATYGVMGGFMQPQGHLQVLYNLSLFGFNPQSALDAPRICLDADPESEDNGLGADSPVSTATTIVSVEQGVDPEVIEGLKKLGHKVVVPASHQGFGRGQVIKKTISNGKLVWSAGSDMRADGCALPQI